MDKLRKARIEAIKVIKNKNNKIMENNECVINVNLENETDCFSSISDDKDLTLSSSMAEYLNNKVKGVPPKANLKINVNCKTKSDKFKNNFKNAVKDYYENEFIEAQREIIKNRYIYLIMLGVGLVLFALAVLLTKLNAGYIIEQLVEIMAWVFIWEFVDIACFRQTVRKFKQYHQLKLITAEINFVND